MTALQYLCIFFIGALFGSFYYTLSIRFLNGSFANSPIKALISFSRCPECKEKISAVYLIPVLGYLALLGKCKNCGKRISPAYPVFEIIYGLVCILTAYRLGIGIYSLVIFLIIGLTISISVIDAKSLTIPDSLVIVFVFLSLYPVFLNREFTDQLIGAAVMFGFFFVVLMLFPGSFGGGDIKFATAIGFLAGLQQSIVVLEAALIIGSITGLIYAAIVKKGLRTKIAFAPFLSSGIFLSLLYGRDIVLLYSKIIK